MLRLFFSVSILIFSVSGFAKEVAAKVKLSPTGNFEAKTSEISGVAQKVGNGFVARNVKVSLKNLNSGIELRDKHMKEKYLEVEKFPEAELIEANGSDGKGTGKIRIKGIEKEISGTYKDLGNGELEASFPLSLADFKIEGIRYMGVGVKDQIEMVVSLPIMVQAPNGLKSIPAKNPPAKK